MAQDSGRFTPKKIDTSTGAGSGAGSGTASSGSASSGSASSGTAGSSDTKAAADKVPGYASSGRYTPRGSLTPSSAASRNAASGVSGGIDLFEQESPAWVAWLMFGFFGIGLAIIVLNYTQLLLPGAADNWYLLGGLGAIIAGFITATKLK
jgi:Cell division protein CrgA